MTNEIKRLREKLNLWETPGFSSFISDLQGTLSDMVPVVTTTEVLRRIYVSRLKKLEEGKSKYKQQKLNL